MDNTLIKCSFSLMLAGHRIKVKGYNESVALNSTLQVIIKKLDDLSGGQFTNEYKNNNLSEVEKIIKMAIGRGNLDMTEREEICKYIDNSHNV